MRVLCVCPRFAPANAADSHRLRLLLPYFASLGCEAEVLTVDPADVTDPKDPWLAEMLPPNVSIHRVRAWTTRAWGLNGLAQRSFSALNRKGNALLGEKRFDLVFFSTTEFLLHGLGPLWKRRFGVPFCMDFQDPWVNDYYRRNPHVEPPGGRLKFALSDRVHRSMESRVVRQCSGFLSVSGAYLQMLDERYGDAVSGQPRCVAPFPAEPRESAPAATRLLQAPQLWRYVGRGGADMAASARAFFRAWRLAIEHGRLRAEAVRFEAIGTSYDPSVNAPKTIEPLALEEGLNSQVSELPARVSYSEMLHLLADSDALIVFGSDDPGYTASKIYPYLLAGKPLLAIFHRESSVTSLMASTGGGVCIGFDDATSGEVLVQEITKAWFTHGSAPQRVPIDWQAFEPYTAASQARRVFDWFVAACQYRK